MSSDAGSPRTPPHAARRARRAGSRDGPGQDLIHCNLLLRSVNLRHVLNQGGPSTNTDRTDTLMSAARAALQRAQHEEVALLARRQHHATHTASASTSHAFENGTVTRISAAVPGDDRALSYAQSRLSHQQHACWPASLDKPITTVFIFTTVIQLVIVAMATSKLTFPVIKC
ncbi:unnamed protein product [Chrysodeixis includens]|uniref:Uncharacterized protein n=1 Tax=Chrysodeixis includens TaxID=689277 RepID=A0A9N8KVZ6_CHRIL|nr:unnamed protein product [Chrysodeixis includens]